MRVSSRFDADQMVAAMREALGSACSATRWVAVGHALYAPETFSMTAGVTVPLDLELLKDALDEVPQLLRKSEAQASDDRRLAEAIYRVALADGIMERIAYRDPEGDIE
jgi:hypothetical protein